MSTTVSVVPLPTYACLGRATHRIQEFVAGLQAVHLRLQQERLGIVLLSRCSFCLRVQRRSSCQFLLTHTQVKSVPPALVPKMSYEGMLVGNGQDAGLAWVLLVRGGLDYDEQMNIRKGLLEYCGQDTLALVKILRMLRSRSQLTCPTRSTQES